MMGEFVIGDTWYCKEEWRHFSNTHKDLPLLFVSHQANKAIN